MAITNPNIENLKVEMQSSLQAFDKQDLGSVQFMTELVTSYFNRIKVELLLMPEIQTSDQLDSAAQEIINNWIQEVNLFNNTPLAGLAYEQLAPAANKLKEPSKSDLQKIQETLDKAANTVLINTSSPVDKITKNRKIEMANNLYDYLESVCKKNNYFLTQKEKSAFVLNSLQKSGLFTGLELADPDVKSKLKFESLALAEVATKQFAESGGIPAPLAKPEKVKLKSSGGLLSGFKHYVVDKINQKISAAEAKKISADKKKNDQKFISILEKKINEIDPSKPNSVDEAPLNAVKRRLKSINLEDLIAEKVMRDPEKFKKTAALKEHRKAADQREVVDSILGKLNPDKDPFISMAIEPKIRAALQELVTPPAPKKGERLK